MTTEEQAALDETTKKPVELSTAEGKKGQIAEEQMRQQTFNTMVALEEMANAVTAHLNPHLNPFEGVTRISGDLEVEGNLAVKGMTTVVNSEAGPGELENLGKVVAKHHQALGLIATFGMMKDKPASGTEPAWAISKLLGMKACKNCVGTGWIASDETCEECGRTGYIKV